MYLHVCKVSCVHVVFNYGLPNVHAKSVHFFSLFFLLTSTILYHVAFCMCKQASDFIMFIFPIRQNYVIIYHSVQY